MNPQFYGKVVNGKWVMNRPQVFEAYCAGRKDGSYFLQISKSKGSPKTMSQLAYYYAVIVPHVLKGMVEAGNENMVVKIGERFVELPLSEDVVDKLLKVRCAKFDGKKVTNKANMSKAEAMEFIDNVIRWSAKYLGCVIPPPDTGEEK